MLNFNHSFPLGLATLLIHTIIPHFRSSLPRIQLLPGSSCKDAADQFGNVEYIIVIIFHLAHNILIERKPLIEVMLPHL